METSYTRLSSGDTDETLGTSDTVGCNGQHDSRAEQEPYWLLIETGSNQEYIFETSKQRLQVAASAVVRDVGMAWITDALAEAKSKFAARSCPSEYDHLVKASGIAAVIVPSEDFGKRVISEVTRKSLQECFDVDVWGVVVPIGGNLGESLQQGYKKLAQVRMEQRRIPLLRAPANPFTARCVFTSRTASKVWSDDPSQRSVSTEKPKEDSASGSADQSNGASLRPISAKVAALLLRGSKDRGTLLKRLKAPLAIPHCLQTKLNTRKMELEKP